MDTMSIQLSKYQLHGKWNLYYHLPHDSKWDLDSYTVILGSIDTAEKVVALNNAMNDGIVKNCMLFLMREGITPTWEDKKNRDGGCFSFKVSNKHVHEVWKILVCLTCGETLLMNRALHKHVNGITISPKKSFCIIKIWMDTIEYQDPMLITPLQNVQNCLFKRHTPEF